MRIRFHENVRFCPKCGVEALERDYHRQSEPQPGGGGEKGRAQTDGGTEWVCKLCGFGFKIGKSTRYHLAEELIKRDRALRNAVKFNTKCVGQAIADAFIEAQQTDPQLLP